MKTFVIRVVTKGFQFLLLVVLSGLVAAYFVTLSRPGSVHPSSIEAYAAEAASDIDLRCAQAELELARVDLESLLDQTGKPSSFYSPVMVAELRLRVNILEEWLKQLQRPGRAKMHLVYARKAEGELKLVELRLQQTLALKEKLTSSVSDLEVERMRLVVKIARLTLEKSKDPAFIGSEMDQILWKVAQLQRDVQYLRIHLAKRIWFDAIHH